MSEDRKSREAVPVGNIIDAFIARTERESVRPGLRVRDAWEDLVGERHISGTRLADFREGRVTIEVKSPPLCAELAQFRRRELLGALRRSLGDDPRIKEIRFRLGAW